MALLKEKPSSEGQIKGSGQNVRFFAGGAMDILNLLWTALTFFLSVLWTLVWFVLRDLVSTLLWILNVAWL